MRKRKILILFLAFMVIAGGISHTLHAQVEEEEWMRGRDPEKFGGTLILAQDDEPLNMDSLRTTYGAQAHIFISESPFMYSPDGELGPAGWLEEIEQSEDGLRITFHLKEGVTFHDGVPLDAEAFAWLLRERMRDDEIYDFPLLNVPDPDHIVIIDEYTVEIQQEDIPFPELKQVMATPSWLGAMRTPRALERYGDVYGYEMAYGNGPFLMDEWVRGEYISFVRNEDYWWTPDWAADYAGLEEGEDYQPGPPYLEEVILEYVPEASTRVSMLRTREVDGIINVPTLHIEEIEGIPGVEILEMPSYIIRAIEYNSTAAPLDELKVRQALNYAVNRDAIAEVVFSGYAEPAHSPYTSKFLETENTERMYHFNQQKAVSLLEEAGWHMGDDDFRYKDGERLSFELWCRDTSEFRMIVEMVQGMWRALGADVDARYFDEATVRSRIDEGEHEAVLWEHQWVTKGDMYNWWFAPEYKWYPQKTGYDSEELRNLVAKTYEASSMEELEDSVDELVNYYLAQGVFNPIVRPINLFAIYEDVENIYLSHQGGGWWGWIPRMYDVYLQDVYEGNN